MVCYILRIQFCPSRHLRGGVYDTAGGWVTLPSGFGHAVPWREVFAAPAAGGAAATLSETLDSDGGARRFTSKLTFRAAAGAFDPGDAPCFLLTDSAGQRLLIGGDPSLPVCLFECEETRPASPAEPCVAKYTVTWAHRALRVL